MRWGLIQVNIHASKLDISYIEILSEKADFISPAEGNRDVLSHHEPPKAKQLHYNRKNTSKAKHHHQGIPGLKDIHHYQPTYSTYTIMNGPLNPV